MPITSLNNISVPTEGAGSNQSLLMPKLQYRFRVILEGFGAGADLREMTRQVVDVTRPNVSFEQITIDAYNSRSYLAGKHTWEPITITLRDDIANNLTKLVGRQVQSQLDHKSQRGPSAGTNYKFSTLIEILDGNSGDATEQWQLEGCFITNADYSQTDYAVSDPVTITVTLQYDNAVLNDDIMPPMDFTSDSTIAG